MLLASKLQAHRLTRPTFVAHAPRSRCFARPNREFISLVRAHSQKQLPPELIKARQLKSAGLATSGLCLAAGLAVALNQGISLPEAPSLLLWAAAGLGAGSTALFWGAAQDDVQLEFHKGRLYIQWGSPNEGPPLSPGSVQVCPHATYGYSIISPAKFLQP